MMRRENKMNIAQLGDATTAGGKGTSKGRFGILLEIFISLVSCIRSVMFISSYLTLHSTCLLRDNTVRHQLLIQPDPEPNPVEDCRMPKLRVVPVCDPMALIREVQEATWHTQSLQHIEGLQRLRDNNTVVQIITDHELGRTEVLGVNERVPFLVVGAVVPDGAVVVALDKPDLIGGVGADLRHLAVMADERLELAAEVVALDPVHHVAAEGGAGGDGTSGVDVWHVVAEMLKDLDEVGVWCTAPVVLDLTWLLACVYG
jgi:hypothetical protein